MPTNKQRIVAVGATAAIVFGGAWTASVAKNIATNASQTTDSTVKAKLRTMEKGAQEPKPEPATFSKSTSDVHLSVSINGARNTKGKIYVMVFDNAAAFASYDYRRAAGFAELPASTQRITTNFPHLTGEAYAVSVFHDENGNQEFDMSGSYPTEGYGTSRAISAYDDLKFHQASVKSGPVAVKIFYLK